MVLAIILFILTALISGDLSGSALIALLTFFAGFWVGLVALVLFLIFMD